MPKYNLFYTWLIILKLVINESIYNLISRERIYFISKTSTDFGLMIYLQHFKL